MKKYYYLLLLLLLLPLGVSGDYLPGPRYYVGDYVPVFMSIDELRASVRYEAGGRDMLNPGKIYYKSPYIYVSERYKGVHVINNTDPSNPIKEGFILAPGCIDMAVNGDVLYIDNAIDLVSFDLLKKEVTSRVVDVFPEPLSPSGGMYYGDRPAGTVLVEWLSSSESNNMRSL